MNIVSSRKFIYASGMIFCCVAGMLFLTGLLVAALPAWRARRRRERFLEAPFPKAWAKIIRTHVPHAAKIPRPLRARYARRIKEFLMEKTFEPCGGLGEVSDKIAVIVAANASLLTLGREAPAWRFLHSVLIYPRAFRLHDPQETLAASADGEAIPLPTEEEPPENDGESRAFGSVILSQERVLRDAAFSGNAQNVIIHEFAHQFADTEPLYFPREHLERWEALFKKEMARLRSGASDTILDEYGADDPAEYFAVCTEAFFGTPRALRRAHPEAYAALAEIYALDPAGWQDTEN